MSLPNIYEYLRCEALNFSHNSLKHMMLSCFPWLNLFDSNLIIVAVAVDSVGNPVFRGFSIESTVFLILGQKAAPTDSVEEPYLLRLFDDERTCSPNIYVIRAVEVIGEAAKNIPYPLQKKYPDIPWKDMAGMRDKLIHEYFGIKLDIVWNTVNKELPSLRDKFVKILRDFERNE